MAESCDDMRIVVMARARRTDRRGMHKRDGIAKSVDRRAESIQIGLRIGMVIRELRHFVDYAKRQGFIVIEYILPSIEKRCNSFQHLLLPRLHNGGQAIFPG